MNLLNNRWVLLTILSLTWGSSFILIKKSLLAFTPYQVGAGRIVLAGMVLMVIGVPALRRQSRRTMGWMTLAGACGSFFPMFLFPLAQTRVSSAVAGILDSLVPLFVLILGYLFFGMRSRRAQVIGAVVGFVGAGLLMAVSGGGDGSGHIGYGMLVVLATVFYAVSALVIQAKLGHVKSLDLSAGIFTLWLIPGLVVLWASGFFEEFRGDPEQWRGLGYLAILSLVGTAMAVGLFYKLIQLSSAVFAGSVTYLLPVVATGWGLLDGERFTLGYAIGTALIFVGLYLIREKTTEEPESGTSGGENHG